jgi:hypothetical protein
MGNTVLAHVLYASNSKDLDLNTFFSATGNAHEIILLNDTEITAEHLQENPNENLKCIVELVSDNWFQVLKFKMSYTKWHNDFPTRSNYKKFFEDVQVTVQENTSWAEFYNNVKDPSWPNCDSYEMIHTLDHWIQQEILQIYQPPSVNLLESDSLFLEVLSQTYFNMLTVPYKKYFDTAEVYHISDYFLGKITPLKNVCTKILGRQWDQQRSNEFLKKVKEVNSRYFVWLDTIKKIYQKTIEFVEVPVQLELWEQAIIIAKCCEYFKISPMNLEWHNAGCILNENNVLLIELLKRINHGKTI